jgi:hypothetical protein
MALPRRRLSELRFRYRHGTKTRDVIAEGASDSSLLNSYFSAISSDIVAYPVTSIEIDDGRGAVLDNSSRDKVVYIAKALSGLPDICKRLVCLIDSDTAIFHGISPYDAVLVTTELPDLGMYFFSVATARKVFELAFKLPPSAGEQTLDTAMRAASYELAARALMELREPPRRAIPAAADSIRHDPAESNIDLADYGNRLISIGIDIAEVGALLDDRVKCIPEMKYFSNSHDLSEVMLKILRRRYSCATTLKRDDLERSFHLGFTLGDLKTSTFMISIMERLSA